MPEQSEDNNHTSIINFLLVWEAIFFLLGGHKMDLFIPHGKLKSILWFASRKQYIMHQGKEKGVFGRP